jgi:hypothetical protein
MQSSSSIDINVEQSLFAYAELAKHSVQHFLGVDSSSQLGQVTCSEPHLLGSEIHGRRGQGGIQAVCRSLDAAPVTRARHNVAVDALCRACALHPLLDGTPKRCKEGLCCNRVSAGFEGRKRDYTASTHRFCPHVPHLPRPRLC